MLKGIATREDAALSVERGVDAVMVSNHGGRSEESGRGALDSLPEVVEAVLRMLKAELVMVMQTCARPACAT